MNYKEEYLLDVKNLEKSYFTVLSSGVSKEYPVLKGISFQIAPKEFVGIMGRSGCGKTTLLNIIGMLKTADKGTVLYKNVSTENIGGEKLASIRRKEIAFVFQDSKLLDSLTVKENIMLPLLLDEQDALKSENRAVKIARKFGIEELLEKKPYELSGGEKQRTAICRAIATNPQLILADEPTGNLDEKSARIVLDYLKYINEKLGITVIMVTHDSRIASCCKKVIFLKDGKIMDIVKKDGEENEFYKELLKRMESIW